MVRIFRIRFSNTTKQKLYQSKDMFDKWWKKIVATGPHYPMRVEFIAEEVIGGVPN
jgi:hypothetical protein